MRKEIEARQILSPVKQPDSWFGLKYSMNLYRGCQHRCIYCDSRSQCYGIDRFDQDVLVKTNAIDLLKDELSRKRKKGTIGTGSMNDPYMPIDKHEKLTQRALEAIAQFRFPVHVLTKSDLVLRDMELLQKISQVYAAVSFTITTANDELGKKVEPGAPKPSVRLKAIEQLAGRGIYTGILMMPVLPYVQDSEANIRELVQRAADSGAQYILASFGVTLRDRQRVYYYKELDKHFPGVSQRYQKTFGGDYFAPVREYDQLKAAFKDACAAVGMARRISPFSKPAAKQLSLF